MGLWIRWGAWFTRPAAVQAAGVHHRPADRVEELPVQPERPWGCGWFDSSLDLREGLAVVEHQGLDLGLAVAVAHMLAGDRTNGPPARTAGPSA